MSAQYKSAATPPPIPQKRRAEPPPIPRHRRSRNEDVDDEYENKPAGMSSGAILGIIFGSMAGVIFLAIGLVFLYQTQSQAQRNPDAELRELFPAKFHGNGVPLQGKSDAEKREFLRQHKENLRVLGGDPNVFKF